MADEAKLWSPIHSTFEVLVVGHAVGVVMEKNCTRSVDQYWLQALPFLVQLTDLLNILLRCNGFTRIQKATVDQTGSRPPDKGHVFFFGASLALGSALELLLSQTTELSWSLPVVI